MEGLIGGLVLAVVSGLTFVAYRHHQRYQVVSWVAIAAAIVVMVVARAYLEGFEDGAAFTSDNPLLDTVIQRVRIIQFVAIGIILYASALGWLPRLLGLKEKDRVEGE